MSENPFGGTEGGGFDLGAILEQAQQMQQQLVAAQDELARATVDGSAGGVTVTVNGTGELQAVSVASGTFDGSDEESLSDLADLLVAAYRDAKSKSDALAAERLGPMTGGLGGGMGGAMGGLGGPGGPGV